MTNKNRNSPERVATPSDEITSTITNSDVSKSYLSIDLKISQELDTEIKAINQAFKDIANGKNYSLVLLNADEGVSDVEFAITETNQKLVKKFCMYLAVFNSLIGEE